MDQRSVAPGVVRFVHVVAICASRTVAVAAGTPNSLRFPGLQELSDLGEDMPSGRGGMVHAIIELCNKVQEQYKFIINHVRRPPPALQTFTASKCSKITLA